jgi:hypothetical protein
MPLESNPIPLNNNNPTKEIWASSGIYTKEVYSNQPYANDLPLSFDGNTARNSTSTTPTPASNPLNNALFSADLTIPYKYVDDIVIFNNYIHYSSTITGGMTTFNPQSFLEQATNTFNAYNLENR